MDDRRHCLLAEYGAKFGNPKIFVSLVEWADKIITE